MTHLEHCPDFSLSKVSRILVATLGLFTLALYLLMCPVGVEGGSLASVGSLTPLPTPGKPSKISFDPSEPFVTPGNQIKITATVMDDKNVPIPNTNVNWDIADKEHEEFVMIRPKDNELTVVGLFGSNRTAKMMPSMVPVIVTYTGEPKITRVVNIRLTDTGKAPGPIPPGLKPQVDVMWSVIPQNVVLDNFGGKIKKAYYGVHILIGNNSGYDLQIASVGFTLRKDLRPKSPSGARYMVPATSYQLARGSLVRSQEVGPRSRVMNSINALGPVLTGFVPFFKVTNRRSNFSQLTNIFSNPFEEGAKLIFPDTTIGQLNRLEQLTFRNDQTARTIIPNNTQISTVAFFPKDFIQMKERDGRDEPLKVMEALGDLVLVGEQVDYLNRVRLIGTPEDKLVYSISGAVVDECGNGIADVAITLSGGPFFKEMMVKTNSEGVFLFENVPAGSNYKVSAAKNAVTIRSRGNDSFLLDDDRDDVDFVGRQATYNISGKVLGPTGQGIKDMEVQLSDGKSATTKSKEDGSYSFEGLAPGLNYTVKPKNGGGFTFDAATATRTFGVLNCNQSGVNFTSNGAATVPTPTPTPTP